MIKGRLGNDCQSDCEDIWKNGCHQQVLQPWEFLAGAVFFQKQHVPFPKRRLLGVLGLIMGETRLRNKDV